MYLSRSVQHSPAAPPPIGIPPSSPRIGVPPPTTPGRSPRASDHFNNLLRVFSKSKVLAPHLPKLMKHQRLLRPHLPLVVPHIEPLTPHLPRILDSMDVVGPHLEALSLSLPLAACVRLCIGRAEDPTLPWAFPTLLERTGAPPPPPPSDEEHRCLTLLFASPPTGGGGADGEPLAVHLIAASHQQLEAWYLGCQPLATLWPSDRVAPGTLRWRALQLQARGARQRALVQG